MNSNRTRLQSYLNKSAESEKKQLPKSDPAPAGKDKELSSKGRNAKSSANASLDGLTDVTPPPELGDNLNA